MELEQYTKILSDVKNSFEDTLKPTNIRLDTIEADIMEMKNLLKDHNTDFDKRLDDQADKIKNLEFKAKIGIAVCSLGGIFMGLILKDFSQYLIQLLQ